MTGSSRQGMPRGAITGVTTAAGAGVGIVLGAIVGGATALTLLLVCGAAVGVVVGAIIEAHRGRATS